jgi:hypothetical protein
MLGLRSRTSIRGAICGVVLLTCTQSGCTTTGAIIGGIVGVTVLTGLTPSNEIDQVYYLGVFDPQEQIPPTVYRVRVRGQASAISFMRFASGWVPASLVDSLGTSFKADETGITISKTGQDPFPTLPTGRKLMLFGPEGFRVAPKDHRLVLIMGANPKSYFEAIESALGSVSDAQITQRNEAFDRQLFEALVQVKNERERLLELDRDIKIDFPNQKEEAQ